MSHIPVLCDALLDLIELPSNAVVVDATVGQAGHAELLAKGLSPQGCLIGFDVDPDALAVARRKLEPLKCRVELIRENFSHVHTALKELELENVDMLLADLGVNSAQLGDADRGFSFQTDGPLDMRMDDRLPDRAAELVNSLDRDELADLLFNYGEERKSRRIARYITDHRKNAPITTTAQLAHAVNAALRITTPGRRSRIHPATRTFQALRIAVNDELENLKTLLQLAPNLLNPAGWIAIISFHSLEDRIVKYNFRENKAEHRYEIITKKPLVADDPERRANPRSRSAKLRIARRTATP